MYVERLCPPDVRQGFALGCEASYASPLRFVRNRAVPFVRAQPEGRRPYQGPSPLFVLVGCPAAEP